MGHLFGETDERMCPFGGPASLIDGFTPVMKGKESYCPKHYGKARCGSHGKKSMRGNL